jgi:uncharacterized membrane protein HdeD (DUF308 family)
LKNNFTKNTKLFLLMEILGGILMITLGIVFMWRDQLIWNLSYAAFLIVLGYAVIYNLYHYFVSRHISDLLLSLGSAIFFIVLSFNPLIFIEFTAILFGVWALFKALTHAFDLYVAIIKKQRGKLAIVFDMLVDSIMAIFLIKSSMDSYFLVNLQVGIFMIIRGILNIISSYRIVVRDGYQLRLPAPVVITGFLPMYLIKKIDKDVKEDPSIVREVVESTEGNYISLYLYAKDHGYNRMGHVDFGYNGVIYSYGNHDPYDRHITQGYGAGLLIVGSERDYVQYCVNDDTTVFRFVVSIDDEQREEIERRISLMMKDAYYYDYPMDKPDSLDYYLGQLRRAKIEVDFYKFSSGRLKTYNIFTTNCIMVTEYILQSTGMRLFRMNGLITPGTYYAYLNQNIGVPGSVVERKEVYRSIASRNKYKKH